MTAQQLAALRDEARKTTSLAQAVEIVDELAAEAERLQAVIARHLVEHAAWSYGSNDVRCLACFAWSNDNRREEEKYRPFEHKPDCPAFTPEGKVK